MQYETTITSPIGELTLIFQQEFLIGIRFSNDGRTTKQDQNPSKQVVVDQLHAYFNNPYFRFNIPLKLLGTDHQQKVWHALQEIPVGTTITYGELAKSIKSSARAVGQACRKNPIPIIFPCHRVVGVQGLTGYSGRRTGKMLEIKEKLLKHESMFFSQK
ncbi:MAG: methylated-DNA--[protein]-cysteine S-methyltransferase [Pseudomonadota bacterium]|nr:methylated-DNA--[protein]-cysteine S-methyltransferase [Gammaproteobacteria bacterium]MBU1558467.1 methylated-DNA--[protein]-cysteine S-methyltransferase [Gammaproteobacteria bacterium]MBU1628600.1 methylated-DNA--[protein]-cysteine S-methyltransferase [Gammaproteobacteria bacterium]MBU2546703.1 methylated-DNA--[protein]-cysteine S-methyltransferase [Gammaproteobacteria bacterium]